MKKTLLLIPIAILTMLTTAEPANNAKATQVFKQTATVYQIKKTGKTYKITNQTKKTADRDLSISKIISVKGKSYYYSQLFKGYINDKAFSLNAKLDAKRAKYNKSSSNKDNANTSNQKKTSTDKIVNGQNLETTDVVDTTAYTNAFINQALNEINQLRMQNGLNAVKTTNVLNNIASQRATQLTMPKAPFTHYDNNGQAYVNTLAVQNGLYDNYNNSQPHMAENITKEDIGGNPIDDAKFMMNDFISEGPDNNDGKEHGHYENLVDPTHTNVGIGVKLTDNNTVVTLVLDFQSKGQSNMVM